ncbi:MAG: type II toxin-antitoxin system VapC family toxin [Sulfuritalea sp.]|nr:type II toxin-antitoxin system VapC family toxin [Sulfuritalea sp.]
MVVDACVWIAAFMAREPHHLRSIELVRQLAELRQSVILPTLTLAEVVGTIARRSDSTEVAPAIRQFLLTETWIEQSSIDVVLGGEAASIAMRFRLRGADAVYVALAATRRVPLITLDAEMLERARGVAEVFTPDQWLQTH